MFPDEIVKPFVSVAAPSTRKVLLTVAAPVTVRLLTEAAPLTDIDPEETCCTYPVNEIKYQHKTTQNIKLKFFRLTITDT